MSKLFIAAFLLFAALFATGCYDMANSFSNGVNEAVFQIGLVITGGVGAVGIGLCVVALTVDRVGSMLLVALWLVGGVVLALTALGTDIFHPWPGSFGDRDRVLLALPQPAVLCAFLATARFIGDASWPTRKLVPWAIGGALSVAYVGVLFNAAYGFPAPNLTGKIVQIAPNKRITYVRTDAGQIVTSFGRALPGRYKLLDASDQAVFAIDDQDRLVELGGTSALADPIDGLTGVRDVSVAESLACIVDQKGAVRCLDAPSAHSQHGPFVVSALTDAIHIQVGKTMVCAADSKRHLKCALLNAVRYPIAREPSNTIPDAAIIDLPGSAVSFAVSNGTVCVANEDGTVSCQGSNEWQELGQSAPVHEGSSSACSTVPGLSNVRELSAGAYHFCALTKTGEVWCWGGNGWSQLGASALGRTHAAPIKIELPGPAHALYRHPTSTCASLDDGRFYCWGAETQGELIRGRTCDTSIFGPPTLCSETPVLVDMPSTAIPFKTRR